MVFQFEDYDDFEEDLNDFELDDQSHEVVKKLALREKSLKKSIPSKKNKSNKFDKNRIWD